ncbi:MAG TPA: ABC transporter permease, partial [Gemmatimonadaceae bacterium]|nr:ABC transporter permease [Gemmatimonadaceae bacterium]
MHEWRSDGIRNTDGGQETYDYEHYLGYRAFAAGIFDGVAAARYAAFSLRLGDDARTLSGIVASDNYFRVLGLHPALGRCFTVADGHPRPEHEIVVSHEFWQRELGGASTAIGQVLHVDGRPLTVVGVAPPGFHGTMVGLVADVWVPVEAYRLPPPRAAVSEATPRRQRLVIFGRLRPGVTAAQGAALLSHVAPRFAPDDAWTRIQRVELEPYVGMPAMGRKPFVAFFTVLGVTAGLVLLIAATNVAGMLLARATYRRREIAVRLSLGAGRRRLIRQLLTEGLVLAGAASLLGVAIASWLPAYVISTQASTLPPGLSPDGRVLAYAVVMAVVTCVLFSLA